ncbi:MAG: amidohydrolase [Anaerolineae bacterium]
MTELYTHLKAQAFELRDELIARRRDFHQHPELAFEEIRTSGIVARELSELGFEVQSGVGKTGVIGILEGAHDGPTVLLRADMDALPIIEENETEFMSQSAGKMHACGHDGHTSIALGVAKLLSQHRDQMAGRVKFVFQPAEEIARGAAAMVSDGALTHPQPDVTVGLHLWNSLPYGTLGVASGPVMASASNFTVKITGKGGHAASPHVSIDPIVCAAQMITLLQTIVSRNVDPFETAVVSVAQVRAGDAHNIIPQFAEMVGTIRTFRLSVRDQVVQRFQEIVENTAKACGCIGEVSFTHLTKPVINHDEVSARLRDLFKQVEPSLVLDQTVRTMGAEDVSEFMADIPGMYFFLGAADQTQDAYYGHHHPRFSFDEAALPLGVALLSSAVASYVLPDGGANA